MTKSVSSGENDIVINYFVEKSELFRVIMDSKTMIVRAKKIAKGIAKQLIVMGLEKGYILDVGCGTGRISLELAELGYNVVGIDISPRYIEIAQEKAKARGLNDRTIFKICDARYIDLCNLNSTKFDAILFIWSSVIGYYDRETDIHILSSIKKLVNENGLLFFVDFVNKDYLIIELSTVGPRLIAYDYDDFMIIEHTIFNPVTSEVLIKQRFYKKNKLDLLFIDENMFKMKVYSLSELVDIARKSGWCVNKVLKDIEGEPGYTPFKPLNAVFTLCKNM